MTITNAPTTIDDFPNATVPMTERKINAFRNRLKDTKQGWAWAHLLPFAPLFYAWTRRTITPAVYTIVGTNCAALAVGIVLVAAGADLTDKQAKTAGRVVSLAVTPMLAKAGIDKARKHAAIQLGEEV